MIIIMAIIGLLKILVIKMVLIMVNVIIIIMVKMVLLQEQQHIMVIQIKEQL